jgi:signal transduction histidine kinase/ActR/RegA family two-component response regulator
VAATLLREAGMDAEPCATVDELLRQMDAGAGAAVVTEEALRTADLRTVAAWLRAQPPWSDFPFLLLTARGGGLERNPVVTRMQSLLGNVAFLERPFHPTTLVSAALTALRGRRRQYEARARLEELRELNATLERRVEDEIAERLGAEARLRQAQKMEAVGQLTGGVAHDFNNLLQALASCLQMIERRTKDPGIAALLDSGQQAVNRGAKLTQQLMGFARREALRAEAVDVRDQILGMSGLLSRALPADVRLAVEIEPGLWPVEVDPTQFELAVLNIAVNSRDAMPDGGRLTITAANASLGHGDPRGLAGDFVRLTVSDTGTGMAPEVLDRVFEPFFTTKTVGKGSGLGLSQVHGFARQSGGTVEIGSTPGQGTSVSLLLPRSAKAPARADEVAALIPLRPSAGGKRVLMVEDDPLVGAVVASALVDIGFAVKSASTAEEALALLEGGASIDLLFTDVVMPGTMSGIDLAKEVRRRNPGLPVLLATGYSRDVASIRGGFRVLAKPYRIDALVEALGAELGERPGLPVPAVSPPPPDRQAASSAER